MNTPTKRSARPWIGLAIIVAVYALTVVRFNPSYFFGATQDDSLYFSSARALATHQGYVLPSVPGTPVATKYPILYPWLLSWVWRFNPSFPSNLKEAVGLTIAFGAVFLIASFHYFRRLKGIGDLAALALTFFVALHPLFLYYSGGVLSDVPFAAMAFIAMLLADRAMRPGSSSGKTAGCAILTGCSILMRAFGIPVAMGILAAAMARRAWRQVAIFCAVLVPFGLAVVWRWIFMPPAMAANPEGGPWQAGFSNLWAYYMSYGRFWKISVPNVHILWAMVRNGALLVVHSPSDYFLEPWLLRGDILSLALAFLVTAGIFSGLVRESRGDGPKSVYWVLPLYMLLVVIWNFPNTNRFSLLFLPFFAGGLWVETRHFLGLLQTTLHSNRSRGEKAVAMALAMGVAVLVCALGWNYARGARPVLTELAAERSSLLAEKQEAYQWLASETSPDDIVIAYEDASLYLYANRHSLRPVVFPTSGQFDLAYLHEALGRITDVGHAVGARYWLIADDDFDLEWSKAGELGRIREAELERGMPITFKSRGGRVRIYRLGQEDECEMPLCPQQTAARQEVEPATAK
jgi:hypothetical protein